MSTRIHLGEPPIGIVLKPSARARRMTLRVSRIDGRVMLTLPAGASTRAAVAFAEQRQGWLRRQLADVAPPVPLQIGGRVPVEGRELPVTAAEQRAVTVRGGRMLVPARRPELTAARIAAYLRALARDRVHLACGRHARTLGRSYGRISLRDTRSRWGSCTAEGNLMFSWRLVMAPADVLDYVAAHEIAHLAEMNHSPAFWDLVRGLCPGYAAPRAWLRENGAALHRYRFKD